MDTLTKKDIMNEVALQVGLDQKTAGEAVETFIEIIKENLMHGEEVHLSGFGKWCIRHKRARRGRNPQTGEEMMITPRKVVTFSLSKVLRAQLEKAD